MDSESDEGELSASEQKQRRSYYQSGSVLTDWLTLIVLFFTMAGVFWYAYEARKQNIDQMFLIRPVVMSNGMHPDGLVNQFPTVMHSVVANLGKTVALTVALPGELAIGNSESPAPFDSRCSDNGMIPKDIRARLKDVPITALAQIDAVAGSPGYYSQDWKLRTGDTITDMGGKALYAVGCVYYTGLDGTQHYGDICAKWIDGGFHPCDSKERNYIK